VDDADVEAIAASGRGCSGEGSADSDVVQPAIVAEGEVPLVSAVVRFS
jgi:hypothetical protein